MLVSFCFLLKNERSAKVYTFERSFCIIIVVSYYSYFKSLEETIM